jgi:DNA mismatch repair protein MutL
MTTQIQTLPLDVIHLIAAGEVIDSLEAVVRELAENALDANATRITVSLWTDCWRVRVADNGAGMSLADLEQAALPHCTSKIQDSSDLTQICSLGFRGEALHSIARLAELEICSRCADFDAGYRVSYDHQGEPVQIQPMALAPGTIVTASQLFQNWPGRRQSLADSAQSLRLVQQTIQQLALCHPHVTWQVEQHDRPWFSIWAGSAKLLLTQFIKDIQPADLYEFSLDRLFLVPAAPLASPCRLHLLLGLPDRCHRHRPDWIKIAVNRRIVQLPELEQTILSSLRKALPRDRYPICFLVLEVPPDQVDWNRHPAKAEIYLQHVGQWQIQVKQAIQQALHASVTQLSHTAHAARLAQVITAAEAEGVYHTSRSIQPDQAAIDPANALDITRDDAEGDTSSNTDSDVKNETKDNLEQLLSPSLLPLRAVAQVHNMYILVEHPSGFWLVEQHIAHERILYEQLCDRWQIAQLPAPLMLGMLSSAQIEQLQRLEIAVEPFGEQRWAARSAPEQLISRNDCAEALLELSRGGDLESALVATACRTAIRNGTVLSLPEMQRLLEQWRRTRNPRTCPHGRPIYLSFEETNLARWFRRHWVIGKSHGI